MSPGSGAILTLSTSHRPTFEERVSDGRYRTIAVDRDLAFEAVQPVVVISDDEVIAVGSLARGPAITTRDRRLTLDQLMLVGPWPLSEIAARMPAASGNRIVRKDDGTVPTTTWQDFVRAFATLDPDAASLLAAVHGRARLMEGVATQIEERDAVRLALDIAGLPPMRLAAPIEPGHHFLDGAEALPLLEDPIVIHDALAGFPGWTRDLDPPRAYGFTDAAGRHLTVMNVNRDKLERVMGVDLLYYQVELDSFVLVQYKRLQKEGGVERYRPSRDRNFEVERDRMRPIRDEIAGQTRGCDTPSGFRLWADPFYFKLCSPYLLVQEPLRLIKGMYVPLALWDSLEKSSDLAGPRGGVSVGWDNAGRWLNNTLFARLVSEAWIGTCGQGSRYVADLIRTSLGLEKMVVLAIEHPQAEPADDEAVAIPASSPFFAESDGGAYE